MSSPLCKVVIGLTKEMVRETSFSKDFCGKEEIPSQNTKISHTIQIGFAQRKKERQSKDDRSPCRLIPEMHKNDYILANSLLTLPRFYLNFMHHNNKNKSY